MSYSFTVRAATKAEAKEKVAAEMAKVVAAQPIHAMDEAQACAAASAFMDMLPDDDSKDVSVSVHGSLGWNGSYPDTHTVTHSSVGVSAAIAVKEAPAA